MQYLKKQKQKKKKLDKEEAHISKALSHYVAIRLRTQL